MARWRQWASLPAVLSAQGRSRRSRQDGRPRKADATGGSPTRATVVQIRLLGRFAVLRGQEEIPLRAFGGPASAAAAAAGAAAGNADPQGHDRGALWPRRPPADPGGNIEVLVSRIRRALGDPALIRTGPAGYSLTEGRECRVDAEAFLAAAGDGRRLLADRPAQALACFRDALELWRGEPLAEDTYADWAQPDRRCLSLALADVLDGAAAAALACGDPASASTWAERATAREPLREASAMLAVRALDAGGDPAGALAAFGSFLGRLADEAGLAPSPEALELRQCISTGNRRGQHPASRGSRPRARLNPCRRPAARKNARRSSRPPQTTVPGWPGCPAASGNCWSCWRCSAGPPRLRCWPRPAGGPSGGPGRPGRAGPCRAGAARTVRLGLHAPAVRPRSDGHARPGPDGTRAPAARTGAGAR